MESSKRAAEPFARDHHAKKARFDIRNPSALAPDAQEEDAILDADVIGARGHQTRRTGVNIDGYESDSGDERGFDARARRKADEAKPERDDMFADLEEDDDEEARGAGEADGDERRKKEVKFLGEGQIEGEVKSSRSGGHVSADFSASGKGRAEDGSSSESDVNDEVRAQVESDQDEEVGAGGNKKHAPKLDAFNMRSENEEGAFDESGNYVRKAADPDDKYDNWLEGVSKGDMRRAREGKERREREEKERKEEAEKEDREQNLGDVLGVLVRSLEPRENPTQALGRLERARQQLRKSKGSKKSGYSGWSKKKKQQQQEEMNGEAEGNVDTAAEEQRIKLAADSIIDAAAWLDNGRIRDAYQARREYFIDQWEDETGKEWTDG